MDNNYGIFIMEDGAELIELTNEEYEAIMEARHHHHSDNKSHHHHHSKDKSEARRLRDESIDNLVKTVNRTQASHNDFVRDMKYTDDIYNKLQKRNSEMDDKLKDLYNKIK